MGQAMGSWVAGLLALGCVTAQGSDELQPAPDQSAAAPQGATTPDAADAPGGSGGDLGPSTIPVQEANAPAEDATTAASGSRAIEEIVVTAQKREENIKDVPISVAAFSGGKLEALGVTNSQDLQLVVPGMSYTTPVGYSIVYIRGIGTDAFLPSADSSVATYIDGVYFPFGHGLASSFAKLERIEVLKGPQGTLFGRNSTGGAINIITKKPNSEPEASIDLTYSKFNDRNVKGFLAGPLFGDVSASLAFLYHDSDLWMRGTETSPIQDKPDLREKGLFPRFQWEITDELSFMLSGLYVKSDGDNTLNGTTLAIKPTGELVGDTEGTPLKYNQNTPGILNTLDKVGYSVLEWQPDPLTIKALGSYQDVRAVTSYDFDGGPTDFASFSTPVELSRTVTGELQLISKPGGFLTFSDAFQWTAGYYYFYDVGGYDPATFIVGDPEHPTNDGDLFAVLGGLLGGLTDLGIPIPDRVALNLRGLTRTNAHAGYLQTTWRPVEWVGLTAGGRYQYEKRALVKSSSALARPNDPEVPLLNFTLSKTTTSSFSPKLAVDVKPFGDDTMFYASWQKGFKSGTYNIATLYTEPDYVKPEKVRSVEVGIKGYLFDRALSYDVAAFQNRVKDVQTLIISLTSGGAVHLVNAAQETIKGADIDLTWQVLPDTLPGLVLTANGAYLHGRYDDFPNGSGFDPSSGLFFGPGALVPAPPVDFSGNTTTKTPKWSGSVGVSHTIDVPGGNIELGVNGSFNSGFYYDTQNAVRQSSYKLLDARASYLYEPWGLRLTLFGKNLTDKTYSNGALTNDFATIYTYAPPRIIGLTLGWEYR